MSDYLADAARCSGCGLCQLVCPAWRQSADVELTPLGRCKALQHGAAPAELATSLASCNLCGACEVVCPERIDLFAMTRALRGALLDAPPENSALVTRQIPPATRAARCMLVADAALRARPDTLARVLALLGGAVVAEDDGADIVAAIASGSPLAPEHIATFVSQFPAGTRIVVADGLLLRQPLPWPGGSEVLGLGAALGALPAVRDCLRTGDLYVIEPCAYHADYERQVVRYDALRIKRRCEINLDLQRIAIPAGVGTLPQAADATAQARWIVQGRQLERIVIESENDRAAFEGLGICPVLHLADVAVKG
jgi:ferredoxin